MSENFWTYALVVGAIVVVILVVTILLRKRLSKASFEAEGIKASVETHAPLSNAANRQQSENKVTISGNTLKGRNHEIDVGRSNVTVDDNSVKGSGTKITVRPKNPDSNQP